MDKLFIQKGKILKKIDYDDIYYITRENSKTYIILKDSHVETCVTLNYLSEVLGDRFMRTHKSYIVNIDMIDSLEKRSENTYIARFFDIDCIAFITKRNMKIINERYTIIQ